MFSAAIASKYFYSASLAFAAQGFALEAQGSTVSVLLAQGLVLEAQGFSFAAQGFAFEAQGSVISVLLAQGFLNSPAQGFLTPEQPAIAPRLNREIDTRVAA
ncbi:hypothetical protein [Picosynechococcus sp. PCC 7117]|uniref:hypothetical protein n=1 Tax=Picosynechococcus sp. PCC 7117 TaxID=195498 RepID=UPI0012EDEB12|nr:hypothetical protein [Picosynechococcus sp. PCC 7117]